MQFYSDSSSETILENDRRLLRQGPSSCSRYLLTIGYQLLSLSHWVRWVDKLCDLLDCFSDTCSFHKNVRWIRILIILAKLHLRKHNVSVDSPNLLMDLIRWIISPLIWPAWEHVSLFHYIVIYIFDSLRSNIIPNDCRRKPGFNPRSSHIEDSKMVLDTSLFNTQHYKIYIKGKVK